MAQAMFYHLTRSTVEDTLRMLLVRALGQGWRVMLRGTDADRLDWLDQKLWLGADDDFLPHGREGGPHDAAQPVLLGLGPAANGANAVVLVDGALATLDEARAMDRVWLLFDGADAAAVAAARGEWKRLTEAGVPAQYWSEDSGRWTMKTERAAT
jgi:DNA polymerase-3 subunit chi